MISNAKFEICNLLIYIISYNLFNSNIVMINLTRECRVPGHQEYKPSIICLFKECNKSTRWCCAECKISNYTCMDNQMIIILKHKKNLLHS